MRSHSRSPGVRPVAAVAALVVLGLIAYWPIFSAGFIWDDDSYVTANPNLESLAGLIAIWREPISLPQYYPLTHTTFWVERQLFGRSALPHHVTNLSLHLISGLLLWQLLVRLKVAGALLAAALFVAHPIQVESVAWVTERKNTLSTVLALAALVVYLRTFPIDRPTACDAAPVDAPRRPRPWLGYAATLLLYLLALGGKTTVSALPAAILVLTWWRTGRVPLRRWVHMLPMLAIGAAAGLYTGYLERTHVGAAGPEWAFSVPQRVLIAGRAVWFYAAQFVMPVEQVFFYPRWNVPSGWTWQWAFPLAAAGAIAALFAMRGRIGRGPAAGAALFVGLLFPALGFVDVYPMRYSFVADHFAYLATLPASAMAAAGLMLLWRRAAWAARHRDDGPEVDEHRDDQQSVAQQRVDRPPVDHPQTAGIALAGLVICGVVVVSAAWLAHRHARTFHSLETLWAATTQANPGAWAAWHNWATLRLDAGDLSEARRMIDRALKFKPDDVNVLMTSADIAERQGDLGRAQRELRQAVEVVRGAMAAHRGYRPPDAAPWLRLAAFLERQGQTIAATDLYREAVDRVRGHRPSMLAAASRLAAAGDGRAAEALWLEVIDSEAFADRESVYAGEVNYANHLARTGRHDRAVELYQRALSKRPDDRRVRLMLAMSFMSAGKLGNAEAALAAAGDLIRTDADAANLQGVLLAQRGDVAGATKWFDVALSSAPNHVAANDNLHKARAIHSD